MLTFLIGYLIGVVATALILWKDVVDTTDRLEAVKSVLVDICISLLWPIFGVWILWEFFDVWRVCFRNNSETGKKDFIDDQH